MESQLSSHHQKTYQRVFQHPMPHNLAWREVWSMLSALPDTVVVEESNGHHKITRNGQTLSLHRAHGKDIADEQEMKLIRNFLDQSAAPTAVPAAAGTHLLVVIDHREARIYSTELHGSVPERIAPYDPFGYGRDLRNNQDDSNGQRKPEQRSFYEAIAKTLHGAQQILLFGVGTGASSAMQQLLQNLQQHHHEIAERVVGSIAVDEHHLTDDQLLAKARELFVVA